jgi:hypothetical protein
MAIEKQTGVDWAALELQRSLSLTNPNLLLIMHILVHTLPPVHTHVIDDENANIQCKGGNKHSGILSAYLPTCTSGTTHERTLRMPVVVNTNDTTSATRRKCKLHV